MLELDHFDSDDGSNTVFRDVIFLALAGFVAMVLLLLPHLNPPATASEGTPAPGNVIVEISWPEKVDADVDLWVEAPGDVPVGYSNKGGLIFNLLRDDLGGQADVTQINYEVSYSRGVPRRQVLAEPTRQAYPHHQAQSRSSGPGNYRVPFQPDRARPVGAGQRPRPT